MRKTENGMDEIENERFLRAAEMRAEMKKERRHRHAKRWMFRTFKAFAVLCSVLLLVAGGYGVGLAFLSGAERNNVNLNYGSPSVPVEEGEVYSLSDDYAPVDIFARLNWKFSRQSLWYAEMHGTVDTVIQQSVTTYKQYENGTLISADLTESSLIRNANQFCYLKEKDRVMWRKSASKNYDGLDTEWQTGSPYNIMTIGGEHGFKATNGLPAYELSVYVIAKDTVANASPVTATKDGKFRITYDLKPDTWQEEADGVITTKGATAYYINQMIFSGGLTTPPEFKAISVTFTFDENWQVFQTDIEEKYSAKYGPIAAPCVSTSTTIYEYNTKKAHSDAYEEYFYRYADGEVNNQPVEKEITALDCLAEGFGSVLTEPTVLDLDLSIGDTSYRGIVDLDLGNTNFTAFDLSALIAKVKLGALSLWVEQGNAYLDYGGLKFEVQLDELISLVKELIAKSGAQTQSPEEGGGTEDLLSALADGEFTLADGKAELHSTLPILGLNIPVDFSFTIGEDHAITVEKVTANISIGDSLAIGAQLGFGKEHLPALSASEKAEFVPLMPYVNELTELFSADVLHADISYRSEGIAVSGGLDFRLNGFALAGEVQADVSLDGIELSKKVRLSYTDGMLYLDLDGVKVQAAAEEGIALLGQYVTLPDTGALSGLDLGKLINTLLSDEFASLFSSSEQNGLRLAVKGSELLSAFGVDFALGDVTVAVGDKSLWVKALGAEIGLTAGTDVALDTSGYTSILPYVQTLIELFSHEDLAVSFSYAAGDFTAAGEIILGYGSAQKTLSVIYEENFVYVSVEGLQVKANVGEAAELISSLTGAENDPDAKTLINRVLGLDFGSVITLGEENDTLTVLIAGTELLHALGIEFDLKTVTLTVNGGSVMAEAEALGVAITVRAGTPFEPNTDDYIDIVQYATAIATMIKSGYLDAEVSYTAGALSVSGNISLGLETLEVEGTLTLTYGKASQDINIIYGDGTVYLEAGGMKVRAGIAEAVALIGQFMELPKADSAEVDLIEGLLSLDFEKVFTLTEKGDTLSLAIAGTELLHALGIEFDLKTVTLTVNGDSVTAEAEALGVAITVRAGTPFEPNTDDYIDIVQYATAIATMIKSGYLDAEVSYTAGALSVTGNISLGLDPLKANARLALQYGGDPLKQIGIVYADDVLCLTVFGAHPEESLKVSLDAKNAVALVTSLMGASGDTDAEALIEKLLCLDLGKLIPVFEEAQSGDVLQLTVAGNELLGALGAEFGLGDVQVEIAKAGSITVKAAGAEITVKSGTDFSVDTDGYLDLTPLLGNIQTILNDKALSFCGDIFLSLNGFEIDVEIENAVLSFEDGIVFRTHTFVCLQGSVTLEVYLGYDNGTVRFACGALGAEIVISEMGSLKEALLNVYGNLYQIVGNMLVDSSKNPLPAPDAFRDLLGRTSDDGETSIWTELVKALTFTTTKSDVSVHYGDLMARLFFPSAYGFLGVELGDPALGLEGMLYLKNAPYSGTDETGKNVVEFPEMPKIGYLGTEEFEAFIGYLGSAVDLLNATDLTLTFDGTVTSTDEAYRESDGVKYTINASMSTHRGSSNLIHLDVDGKNLWVDTDVFAHASVNITAKSAADSSLYLDLFILDGAPVKDAEGNTIDYVKDNMLDFYVTLSQFGPVGSTADTVPGYNPVRLYAPSDEILTLLSSALPLFGIDAEILNNYMISKWLSLENVAQLKAFGSIVSPFLSGLLGAAETPVESAALAEPAESAEPSLIKDYLKGLSVTAEELSIELNSDKIYGKEGLSDVTATLTKEADTKDEDGCHYGKFTRLDLCNLYNGAGTENTSLSGTVDYKKVTPDVPSGEYQSFLGAERLLLAIAKSATHGVNEAGEVISGEETPHHYAVNNYFYIDGSIGVSLHLGELDLIKLNIDIVAISVTIDEEGKLALNLRLEYKGNYSSLADTLGGVLGLDGHIINGDSTVDLTLKDDMVYIKRVQTTWYKEATITDWSSGWRTYATPITLYRAMPAANFTANIFDHLGFLFNMGDKLWAFISKQINDSSNKETTPTEKVDFGQRLTDVLKSYTFTPEGTAEDGSLTPASWNLVLNGNALAKGVLGDLTVNLKEDQDGYFHDISVNAKIVSVIDANISLRWHNPGGAMEAGAEDKTQSAFVADLESKQHGFGGMMEKLNAENGWTETAEDGTVTYKFLEGQAATVSYKYRNYDGSETDLGSPQDVMVSTGQGGWKANTLFSELTYPAIPADDEQFAYSPVDVSATVGEVLNSFNLVIADQSIQEYEILFYTTDETLGRQFDWDYDEAEHRYYKTQSMRYGSVVDLGGKQSIVTGIMEFEIVADPKADDGRTGVWQADPVITEDGATFTATYPSTITYQSVVQFTMENCDVRGVDGIWSCTTEFSATDYTLLMPTAEGYTFLGWYMKDESGWKQVTLLNASEISSITVEALWVSNLTVTITKAERSNRTTEKTGLFTTTTYYDYAIEATVSGGQLFGAFAKDANVSMTYSFDAYSSGWAGGTNIVGETQNVNGYQSSISVNATKVQQRDQARAHVRLTYTYGDFSYTVPQVTATSSWTNA